VAPTSNEDITQPYASLRTDVSLERNMFEVSTVKECEGRGSVKGVKECEDGSYETVLCSVFLILRVAPHVVVGTGGYVSVPTCIAAVLTRRPLVIQEQNAAPGIANKILAPLVRFAASLICLSMGTWFVDFFVSLLCCVGV